MATAPAFPPAAAVFDLDGTLIDAVADIAAGANRRLVARGVAPLTDAEAASLLGEGLRTFVRRAFELRLQPLSDTEAGDFVEDYIRSPVEYTRLYPGVPQALQELRAAGWRLAVCTNKAEVAARRILEHFGLLATFEVVCGGDAAPFRKPDPRHLRLTLERAGLSGTPAVMIGDNRVDVTVARDAGIPSVFCAWGYGTPDMSAGASAVAQRFGDLPALLPRVLDQARAATRAE